MLGDGKIRVIRDEDNDLYINMWELTSHLGAAAESMRNLHDPDAEIIAGVFDTLGVTLCDLAMYELGMDSLDKFDSVKDMLALWEDIPE